VPRKELEVYFFLPRARPVPVKVGLERNRSAVGKAVTSLVSPGLNNSRPSPAGARPVSTSTLNQGDPPC